MSRLAPYLLALDILVALALGVLAQAAVWEGHVAGPRLLMAPLFLLVGPPLVVRRRLPLLPLVALMGAIVVQALVSQDAAEGAALVFTGLVALYSVAAWGSRRVALAGVAVTVMALIVQGLEDRHIGENIWAAAFFWLAWFAVWLAGLFVGSRRDAAALGRRAVELEQQRAEAIAAERARIARELHDVIAHHLSVVVIQAVAAMGILDRHPERTREPLRRIEQSGREALSELRRLLGILRQDEDRAALTPQPGLAALGALLEGVRGAGLPVELHIEGVTRPLPRGIDVSAYRIVQEALTNTLKHAGVASAQVTVRYGRDALELEVLDTGRGIVR